MGRNYIVLLDIDSVDLVRLRVKAVRISLATIYYPELFIIKNCGVLKFDNIKMFYHLVAQ